MDELIAVFISWQFLLVAAACGALGEAVKRIPRMPDWLIPFINIVFSIVFMMLLMGVSAGSALYGFLAAAVATFVYEMIKQVIERSIGKDKTES